MGALSLAECRNLISITVEAGNPKYEDRNSNAIIEKDTNVLISGCKGTTIPSGVTSIGRYAFYYSGIESLTIPSSVTSIGDGAFVSSNLSSVTFDTPTGWKAYNSSSASSGISLDLSDPATNATYLRTTYNEYNWKHS